MTRLLLKLAIGGVLACLLLTSRAIPSSAQSGGGFAETDIVTPTGSRGVMIRPLAPGPHPAVLHLHGSGDTVANNLDVLRLFARAGYVAIDVQYRQAGPGSIDIQDIYKSLEFLNDSPHVRRGVIGLNGFSLGGRMALRVAARQKVLAVSAIAARTSSGSIPTVLDEAARLTAPILLQHGTDDSVVPYDDAVRLEKTLKGMGRGVEFLSYSGAGHSNLPWQQVYGRVLTFFGAHLR